MNLLRIKTVLISMACTALAICSQAQVTIFYNTNAYGKSIRELAYLQIMNNTAQVYSANLFVEVKNLSSNETVVKLTIPSLTIGTGNNMLSVSRLNNAGLYYASGMEGNYVRQTGLLPEGELEYCFKLVLSSKGNPDEIFENCFYRINIIASPLQLLLPEDGDSLCNKRPRFNWQPPMPLQPAMVYEFKLVKLNKGQNTAEALLVNIPLIYQQNLRGFVLPYPSSAPDLVEGERYAWQVTAVTGGKHTVSEVWSFLVACEKFSPQKGSYRELKSFDDGGFLTTGSELRIAIDNSFGARELLYTIKDLSSPQKEFKRLPAVRLEEGINNIAIDLNKIPGIEEEREYLLTVTLPSGKKVSVRFKYEQEND